jgi:hypothetical protein
MKLTRDMAIFDDNLPFGVKLMGYAMGFTLTIAVLVERRIFALFLSVTHYNPGSQPKSTWREPKRLNHGR